MWHSRYSVGSDPADSSESSLSHSTTFTNTKLNKTNDIIVDCTIVDRLHLINFISGYFEEGVSFVQIRQKHYKL